MQTVEASQGHPALLEVRRLTKLFSEGTLAVDDVSLSLDPGEALGIVGESGSGKSTLARCIVGLIDPTSGVVLYRGSNFVKASGATRRLFRKHVQIVFQNPYSSLNPRMRVEELVAEGLHVHKLTKGGRATEARVQELLNMVGLHSELSARYPRALSGGQRQRVSLARALALQPDVLVCDEPVSSLDVSIQAQIINLLSDLRDSLDLSIIFIAHDLAVVRQLCDRVAVMYRGKIVETARTERLFSSPTHPYTKDLLLSVPFLDRHKEEDRRVARRATKSAPPFI